MSSPLLEQGSALRAVDLQGYGVAHGVPAATKHVCEYFSGASDQDYQTARDCVDQLDPERGDALAIERYEYPAGETPWFEFTTLHGRFRLPELPGNSMPPEARKERAHYLETDAYLHALSPIIYAANLALLKGVPVHYADINDQQQQDFEEVVQELGVIGKLVDKLAQFNLGPYPRYRDFLRFSQLGTIAAAMSTSQQGNSANDRRPTLAFIGGRSHLFELYQLAKENNVPITINCNLLQVFIDAGVAGNIAREGAGWIRPLLGRSQPRLLRKRHKNGSTQSLAP